VAGFTDLSLCPRIRNFHSISGNYLYRQIASDKQFVALRDFGNFGPSQSPFPFGLTRDIGSNSAFARPQCLLYFAVPFGVSYLSLPSVFLRSPVKVTPNTSKSALLPLCSTVRDSFVLQISFLLIYFRFVCENNRCFRLSALRSLLNRKINLLDKL
jgi:hypothetical protein